MRCGGCRAERPDSELDVTDEGPWCHACVVAREVAGHLAESARLAEERRRQARRDRLGDWILAIPGALFLLLLLGGLALARC